MLRASLCGVVLVLCLAVQAGAREISGEGSVSGEGARLNAQAATVGNISLMVTSTGAGWARSSFAQARGIIASGAADFVADGVAVQARTGESSQIFEGPAAADSTAVATGIQVQGRDARSFAVTDLAVQATSGRVNAESQDGALSQARSSATATGMWMLGDGSARIRGVSAVVARSGSATATGGRGESVASAEAIGARVSTGDLHHDGILRVEATGGQATALSPDIYAEARAMAFGLQADSGEVRHSGELSVAAVAGSIRFLSGSGQTEGRLPAQATGISAGSGVSSTGSVSVLATGGTVTDPRSTRTGAAVATGISAQGDVSQTGSTTVAATGTAALATGISGAAVSHSGALMVTSTGDRDVGIGIVASGNALNTGSVSVQADGTATGISAQGDVLQTGSTTVAATGAAAQAIGISGATVIHFGTLRVTSSGDRAEGLVASGNVLNTGSVSVQSNGVATGIVAQGDVLQTGSTTVAATGADAQAIGVSGATVIHSGALQVTSSGDRAEGIGIRAFGDVVNSGSISVQADGPATGVYFMDSGMLASAMPLSVRSGTGENWEVAAAENAVVRVREYNLGLGSGTGYTFGGPGRFSMDQAQLLLRPAPGFVLNKFYRVQSGTLESELGSAVIDGEVASVASLHPDLVAEVATDPTSSAPAQSVALTYSPPSSLPAESAKARLSTVMYTGTVVRDQLTASLFRPLGGRGETARVFARPYASDLRFDGSPAGYRGSMAGAVVGVDWLLGGWTVGLHGGGDETRLDFKGAYDGRDEKSTAIYGGVHAGRLFENGLAPMFTSTLFRVEHRADLGMDESARSRTLAWYNTAGLGYVWRISDAQALIPEVTLSHVWQLRRQHETDTPPYTVNTRFGELNDHELYLSAALRWIAEFPLSEASDASVVRLHAGGGVRRTLTDGKISVEQSLDGINWSRPEVQSERTAGFFSAGFGMRHQSLSWDISAQADMASHARSVGINASLRWDF